VPLRATHPKTAPHRATPNTRTISVGDGCCSEWGLVWRPCPHQTAPTPDVPHDQVGCWGCLGVGTGGVGGLPVEWVAVSGGPYRLCSELHEQHGPPDTAYTVNNRQEIIGLDDAAAGSWSEVMAARITTACRLSTWGPRSTANGGLSAAICSGLLVRCEFAADSKSAASLRRTPRPRQFAADSTSAAQLQPCNGVNLI
jgi:hypothetical protein